MIALYLGMKLEEMIEGSIQRLAEKLKDKSYLKSIGGETHHYFMIGYTEA